MKHCTNNFYYTIKSFHNNNLLKERVRYFLEIKKLEKSGPFELEPYIYLQVNKKRLIYTGSKLVTQKLPGELPYRQKNPRKLHSHCFRGRIASLMGNGGICYEEIKGI